MSWSYDPTRKTTGDGDGIIPRVKVEEAAELLLKGGFRNRRLVVDILRSLSGLGRGEVEFNVGFVFAEVVGRV